MEQKNTFTVTGCEDCPMYSISNTFGCQCCNYPKKEMSCELHVNMSKDCPLKQSDITITLKN